MENYEKLYKEALERAKDCCVNKKFSELEDTAQQLCEYVFPELKESEDDKIRKEIIQSIQDNMCVIHKGKCIAWLEKQGEQKPADKNEPKFKVGDIIKYIGEIEEFSKENHTIKKILDDCYLTIDDMYIPFRFENCYILVNQNSSWSEEDEEMKRTIISNIFILKQMYTQPDKQTDYNRMIEWLKSFKPQTHWKPSEQNIKDLEWCADLVKDKMGVGFHRLQVFIDEIKNL